MESAKPSSLSVGAGGVWLCPDYFLCSIKILLFREFFELRAVWQNGVRSSFLLLSK